MVGGADLKKKKIRGGQPLDPEQNKAVMAANLTRALGVQGAAGKDVFRRGLSPSLSFFFVKLRLYWIWGVR